MQPQAQDIKNQLNGKASSIANSAVAATTPITDQLSDSYEAARDYAVDTYDTTIAYAKKHPGRMLVTGLAVGALAGFLFGRRNK